jgi:hypothetical protein
MTRAHPPLRLHVLSDLHIEHGGFIAPKVACDVVVVAGDLANGRRMTKALVDLCDQVRKPVVYVPGNHDWYQIDIAGEQSSLVRAWRVGAFNLQVLDDGIWRFEHHGTTYRFIGSTWWSAMDWTEDGATGESAFTRVSAAALGCLNDYGLIWKDDRPLTPDDSRSMHAVSTQFLQQQIAEAQAAGEVPIVVTHFLPSRSSCHKQYRGSLVNAYFANDRDDLASKSSSICRGPSNRLRWNLIGRWWRIDRTIFVTDVRREGLMSPKVFFKASSNMDLQTF